MKGCPAHIAAWNPLFCPIHLPHPRSCPSHLLLLQTPQESNSFPTSSLQASSQVARSTRSTDSEHTPHVPGEAVVPPWGTWSCASQTPASHWHALCRLSAVTRLSHRLGCRELPCPSSHPFIGKPTGRDGCLATVAQRKATPKGHSSSEQPAQQGCPRLPSYCISAQRLPHPLRFPSPLPQVWIPRSPLTPCARPTSKVGIRVARQVPNLHHQLRRAARTHGQPFPQCVLPLHKPPGANWRLHVSEELKDLGDLLLF